MVFELPGYKPEPLESFLERAIVAEAAGTPKDTLVQERVQDLSRALRYRLENSLEIPDIWRKELGYYRSHQLI